MRDAALGYAAMSSPDQPVEVFMLDEQKHPVNSAVFHLFHGHLDADSDPDIIKMWWDYLPESNIGARTGKAFDAWDFDSMEVFNRTRKGLPPEQRAVFDAAPTVLSGRAGGGVHKLFAPSGLAGINGVAPLIDFKANNGYVVMAPSLHQSGNRYRWEEGKELTDLRQLQPAPEALMDLVYDYIAAREAKLEERMKARSAVPYAPVTQPDETGLHPHFFKHETQETYVSAALAGASDAVINAPDGGARNVIFGEAASLAGLIPHGLLVDWQIRRTLEDAAATRAGRTHRRKSPKSIATQINDGIDKGVRSPRDLPPLVRRKFQPTAVEIGWRENGFANLCLGDLPDGRIIEMRKHGSGWRWALHSTSNPQHDFRRVVATGFAQSEDQCVDDISSYLWECERQQWLSDRRPSAFRGHCHSGPTQSLPTPTLVS